MRLLIRILSVAGRLRPSAKHSVRLQEKFLSDCPANRSVVNN